MKKLLTSILLFSITFSLSFAAPKKSKNNGIPLSPKDKFAIEGAELGSFNYQNHTVTKKGEILWNSEDNAEWLEIGWELRGTDLSKYAGIRVELASNEKKDITLKLSSPSTFGEWGYQNNSQNVFYAFFDSVGKDWGDMKNPDLAEGFLIKFTVPAKKYNKTIIKSVELLEKEDFPSATHLQLLENPFGNRANGAIPIGNKIIFPKGTKGSEYPECGWMIKEDLSEYDRIRIELEHNDIENLELTIRNSDFSGWYCFKQTEPNIYEANLTGEGANYIDENSPALDKSKGLNIFFRFWSEKPLTKDCTTIIKSVQLLKGAKENNKNIQILGVSPKVKWDCYLNDNGTITWQKEYGRIEWNLQNVDLSQYKKVRIETEGTSPLQLAYILPNKKVACFSYSKPGIYEAYFDGSNASQYWDADEYSTPLDLNLVCREGTKKDSQTIIKSITLLTEEDSIQPETLMLNGVKLGTYKSNAWLDDSFAINWEKTSNYLACGWNLEKLEGEILEIKVSSTDVPLRLRIRDKATNNEASWLDDGTHVFRIRLKDKKQLTKTNNQKEAEWVKAAKPFDLSDGVEIVLEAPNGVFKEGKKTVVESIKIE